LARINHSPSAEALHRHRTKSRATAETSGRHGAERWTATATSGSSTASAETSTATASSAVLTASERWYNQRRARKQRDCYQFSFHNFSFPAVLLVKLYFDCCIA